jgi:hypothetical protein
VANTSAIVATTFAYVMWLRIDRFMFEVPSAVEGGQTGVLPATANMVPVEEVELCAERITEEVGSWRGVSAGPGKRGEFAFKVGHREIGHLHGDHAAHYFFPHEEWAALKEQGRITPHPVFPGRKGPAARRIEDDADVSDVIELIRLNYERIIAGHGLPDEDASGAR